MNSVIRAANKMKNKYKKPKKTIGKRNDNRSKKASTDWLKAAGYLDTKDQDAIRYVYVPHKKTDGNKASTYTGHYIKSEIDNVNLKKSDLATKITAKNILKKYRNLARKKSYKVPNTSLTEPTNAEDVDRADTIETLDDIARLQSGKSAQLAAKKLSEKYKKNERSKQEKKYF